MSAKRVGVLIRQHPLREPKAAEALRMAVGLTLRVPDVSVFFVGDAVRTFSNAVVCEWERSAIGRHLRALIELGQTIVFEKESLDDLDDFEQPIPVKCWPRARIARFLAEYEVTIVI